MTGELARPHRRHRLDPTLRDVVVIAGLLGFVPSFAVDAPWAKAQNLLFAYGLGLLLLGLRGVSLRRGDVLVLLGVPALLLAQAMGALSAGVAGDRGAWDLATLLKQIRDPLTNWLVLLVLLTRPGLTRTMRSIKVFVAAVPIAALGALAVHAVAPSLPLSASFANPRGFIAGFEGPNSLGAAMALLLPLAAAWVVTSRTWHERLVASLAFGGASALLMLSGSRGALLALAVATAAAGMVAIVATGHKGVRLRKLGGALLAAIAVVVAVTAIPNDPIERLARTDWLAVDVDPSTSRRALQLATAVDLATTHPWLGHGFGGYGAGYVAANPGIRPSTTPHNGILLLAAQGGVVGVAVLLAYYVAVSLALAGPLARRRDAWGVALAACAPLLLVSDQFFPYLVSHDVGTVAAVIIALAIRLRREDVTA